MSSALLNFARRAAAQAPARVAARRGVSTSAPKLGGADEPAYIHAEKMYDVGATKGRTLVFGTATAAVVRAAFESNGMPLPSILLGGIWGGLCSKS